MSDLGELIKELAVNAVEAEKPVEVVFGVVTDKKPLKVKLEQKLILDEGFITVCRGADFDIDDKVIMLRCSGGQDYVLIDGLGGV